MTVTYYDIREKWVPEKASIILETNFLGEGDVTIRYVVYAYDGDIYALRFFYIRGDWEVETKFAECKEDIEQLFCYDLTT
jgi:hypothetical protein